MASYLDMDERGRRLYVARLCNFDPSRPENWPLEVIDRIISKSEKAADQTARDEVRKTMTK